MSEQSQQTYGQKAVGLSFNHAQGVVKDAVHEIKARYALLIDALNEARNSSDSSEQKRLLSIAITEAQGAQMWAVKAITWKD